MALRPESVERITAMWRRPSPSNTISIVTLAGDTFYTAPSALQARVARLAPSLPSLTAELRGDIEKFIGTVRLAYLDDEPISVSYEGVEQIADDDTRQRRASRQLAIATSGRRRRPTGPRTPATRWLEHGAIVAVVTLGGRTLVRMRPPFA